MVWRKIIIDVICNQYARLVPVLFGFMLLNFWLLQYLSATAEVGEQPGFAFKLAEVAVTLIKVGLLVVTAMIVISVSQVHGWAGSAVDPLSGLLKQVLIVLVAAILLDKGLLYLEYTIINPTPQDVDPVTFELIPATSAIPEQYWWVVFLLRIFVLWLFHWGAVGAFAHEVATGETRFVTNLLAGWQNPLGYNGLVLFGGYLVYFALWIGHFYGQWAPGTLEFTAGTLFIFILMFLTCIITLKRIELMQVSPWPEQSSQSS